MLSVCLILIKNLSYFNSEKYFMLQLSIFVCRLGGTRPAGPRPPDVWPLQPSSCRSEAGVCQLSLSTLQPASTLPLISNHFRGSRDVGGPAAYQCFQGNKGWLLIWLSPCPLFRWEPWEVRLVLVSHIIISTVERGNTNAKCVHR